MSVLAEVSEIALELLVQSARNYLFIRTSKKAICYLITIALLSIIPLFINFPEFYFSRKDNILNKYGIKLGWFWTCSVVGSFLCLAAWKHGLDSIGVFKNSIRMVIATFAWYICTTGFVKFEHMSAHCLGSKQSSRSECSTNNGKWIPGFDISGHCFLLVYSILIICEESVAFRNIPALTAKSRSSIKNHDQSTISIKIILILMLILHVAWDFGLMVTVIYYHRISQKILGGLIAVCCWYITYHCWYRLIGIPPMPINHKIRAA